MDESEKMLLKPIKLYLVVLAKNILFFSRVLWPVKVCMDESEKMLLESIKLFSASLTLISHFYRIYFIGFLVLAYLLQVYHSIYMYH